MDSFFLLNYIYFIFKKICEFYVSTPRALYPNYGPEKYNKIAYLFGQTLSILVFFFLNLINFNNFFQKIQFQVICMSIDMICQSCGIEHSKKKGKLCSLIWF